LVVGVCAFCFLFVDYLARWSMLRWLKMLAIAQRESAMSERRAEYVQQSHETRRLVRWIQAAAPPTVLANIRLYFNTLFAITDSDISETTGRLFPPNFGAGRDLREFVTNAWEVASQIEATKDFCNKTALSTLSGDNREALEAQAQSFLNSAIEKARKRLDLRSQSLSALLPGADSDHIRQGRWYFFAALVCALRNVSYHSRSAAHTPIEVDLSTDQAGPPILLVYNKSIALPGVSGQPKMSLGSTEQAIRHFARLYNPGAHLQNDLYVCIETGKRFCVWETRVPALEGLRRD